MTLEWHKTSTTQDCSMDFTTPFDRRLALLPHEWRGPLVDVLDTAETVRLKLQEWNLQDNPELLVALTGLVLARRDQSVKDTSVDQHGQQP